MSETAAPAKGKSLKELDRAVVRFAGDSGDGMQLTGEQFTTESAWAGNDIATLPNFPAEIRAPAGTLFGVSRSEEHTSELQSRPHLVCRLLLEKKNASRPRIARAFCNSKMTLSSCQLAG